MSKEYQQPREGDATVVGEHGLAWAVDFAAQRAAGLINYPEGLEPCAYIVWAPWAHPFWSFYKVGCISLRSFPGVAEPRIFLSGATHEVYVVALDPSSKVSTKLPTRGMSPPNFCGQFVADSDAAASERVLGSVRAICEGKLSPDSDHRRAWGHLYSFSNLPHLAQDVLVHGPSGSTVAIGTGASIARKLVDMPPEGDSNLH